MIYKLVIDAFVLTQEFQAALEKAAADRLLSRSQMNIRPGGLGAAVEYYGEQTTPSVLIVEEGHDEVALNEGLASLAEVCEPTSKVIVATPINDVTLYRTLISQGVTEYIVLPTGPRQIVDTIDRIFTDPTAPPQGKLIGFIGARGGCGSSTIACNTAWAISRLYKDDVAIVDSDLAFGTVAMAYNTTMNQTIADALSQPDRLDSTLLERFMVKRDEHLSLLPAPATLRAGGMVDGEALERLLDLLRLMVPFVVLDLPHMWLPWVEHAVGLCDHLVVTAPPDLGGLRDAKSLIDFVVGGRGENASVHLVLNRCGAFAKGELTPKDFSETVNKEPIAALSFDAPLYVTAFNNGQAIGELPKSEKAAEVFNLIAAKVSGRHGGGAAPAKKKSPLAWLSGRTSDKAAGKKKAKA